MKNYHRSGKINEVSADFLAETKTFVLTKRYLIFNIYDFRDKRYKPMYQYLEIPQLNCEFPTVGDMLKESKTGRLSPSPPATGPLHRSTRPTRPQQ